MKNNRSFRQPPYDMIYVENDFDVPKHQSLCTLRNFLYEDSIRSSHLNRGVGSLGPNDKVSKFTVWCRSYYADEISYERLKKLTHGCSNVREGYWCHQLREKLSPTCRS